MRVCDVFFFEYFMAAIAILLAVSVLIFFVQFHLNLILIDLFFNAQLAGIAVITIGAHIYSGLTNYIHLLRKYHFKLNFCWLN